MPRGTFIVIEGTDGSGKGTQFTKLTERLLAEGHDVATFDFPQYEQPSSYFVQQYLNGNYGTGDEVGPYTGSLFYALDRFEASKAIKQAIDDGKVVLANRYTGSNMAHQGTRFSNAEERRGFFIWLDNLEFQMLGIPRPDRSVVLRVPAETAQELVSKKLPREYTDKKRDMLEADLNHLKLSVEVYDDLCQLFPKDFVRIDCTRNKELLSVDVINDMLYTSITPLLPPPIGVSKINHTDQNPYLKKENGNFTITPSGEKFLEAAITSTTDNVYAFNSQLSPLTIAAAMARLSRRGDDMRITILDEFAMAHGKDEKLLQRVITAYGDDSVQQLVGQHVVVEGASNLLTKKLEWGRLASYLEQSTRYIYFDQKDAQGKYKYYTPDYLPAEVVMTYNKTMDAIFDKYSELVHKATDYVRNNSTVPKGEQDVAWKGATRAQACDAVRPVLPVATKSTVGIYASGQALENLIMNLMADDLPEAQETGKKILEHARQTIPTFLERADKPERGGATIAYRAQTRRNMKNITQDLLPSGHAHGGDSVTLTSYWPKNELDLIPDMLYEHSDLPIHTLRDKVSQLPITRKYDIFESYMGERLNRRHKPGRAMENAHYSWDLVCDYGIFRDLQRHRIVDDLNWQMLTPRYGYDTPKLIEDAGLTDMYDDCFDLSLQLFSQLQAAGYEYESQYATLLGHKMRWKVTYNAREAFHLHELRTTPQGHPGYRKMVMEMHEKLCEVHPTIGAAMKFVNQDEDPELTRLAAERYTQFKLNQIN